MENATMFDIVRKVNEIFDGNLDGDLSDEEIKKQLDALAGDFADKADGIKRAMTFFDGEIKTIKEEEERLAARRKSRENHKERLKSYLMCCFEATGTTKLKTPFYTYSMRPSPVSVVIDDKSLIPPEFLVQAEPTVNKKAIKEFLSTGEVSNFAHLESSGMMLTII